MNETLFYVLGLALVAIALIVSFVGLKFDKFPNSRALLVGGTVAIAALVIATMTFAWKNAEDEQAHREAELAESTEQNEASGNEAEADEEEGSQAAEDTTTTEQTGTTEAGDPEVGAQVFASAGCTGCHTLADAGSTGTTGPDLDGALQGKDEEFIRTSIVDPSAEVNPDYPPDVMPQGYGDQLTPEELNGLVTYLYEVAAKN